MRIFVNMNQESNKNNKKSGTKRRTTAKKNAKSKSRHRIGLGWLLAIVSCLAIMGAVAGFCLQSHRGGDTWIYIPTNASAEQIKDSLTLHLGAAEANRVMMLWRLQGGSADNAHGAYKIPHGQRSIITARRIKNRMQTPVKIAWHDIRTMDQLAKTITRNTECSSEEFLAACNDVLKLKGYNQEEYPAAFIPDSYEVYWTASGQQIVERLLKYRDNFWNNERIQKAHNLGLTPVQVATVASIIEEETAKSDERPKVARLYLNRLKRGMKLQADPTVKFAAARFDLRRITAQYLATESPYNTYRVAGLPPGPIRVASKTAIDDVLNAPVHDYIYMCAKEDFSGYHNFASDYPTHQANARRYQTELNKRGIK